MITLRTNAAECNDETIPFGLPPGEEAHGASTGIQDEEPVRRWTDEEIADANERQAAAEAERYDMTDDDIRQCVEPLSRCPDVSSVHVVRQHTHTFRFRTGEIPPREDVYSIGVSFRGGRHMLTGSGQTLADAVLAVMRQVQVIVAAAAAKAVARA